MIELKTYLQLNHHFTCSHSKLQQILECLNEFYDKSFVDKHDGRLHINIKDLNAIGKKYGSSITYQARTIAMYQGV
jgi:hypothetical protein